MVGVGLTGGGVGFDGAGFDFSFSAFLLSVDLFKFGLELMGSLLGPPPLISDLGLLSIGVLGSFFYYF